MRLVVGPTCAGKTTFVRHLRQVAARDGRTLQVHLGFEILDSATTPRGADDVVHFNLLRGQLGRPEEPIELSACPMLTELIEAAEEVTVLAAPRPVLLRRAEERSNRGESDSEGAVEANAYPRMWCRALRMPKLAQIFEQLALHLDQSGKPHRYLCSNGAEHEEFHPMARWDFPRLAARDSEELCRGGHVEPELDVGRRVYQGDFRQGKSGGGRAKTLSLALRMPLARKKVLDIGCAEGAAALSAARMGARVTAIEPMAGRFESAREIAAALDSRIDLRNETLEELAAPSNSYDVVLALNVIHHQHDPFAFLDLAADLASSHLVLEYPGLSDRKYRSTLPERIDVGEDQPLIGLSTSAQDQTFLFTPASLERYLLDTTAVFGRHEFVPSPIAGRWLSIFSDKQRSMPIQPVNDENARLRKALAARDAEIKRLRGVVHTMRASKSWQLTKPLRKIHTRMH